MPKTIPLPHFDFENQFAGRTICGIDEAGRGPLAGPVVAAAVIIPPAVRGMAWVKDLRDSKLLNAAQREVLYAAITAHCVYGIGQASVAEIDSVNILQATFLAMVRATEALPRDMVGDLVSLVDGNRKPVGLAGEIMTLVKGDQLSCSIAAASILAKVTRDRIMAELDTRYPAYGFARHSGYGTPQHLRALAAHGPCPAHRMSFRPIRKH